MSLHYNYSSKSTFDSSIKRELKRYSLSEINGVNFINRHSINDPQEKFINKFERNTGDRINNLRRIILNCSSDPVYFSENFIGSELEINDKKDSKKVERLHRIIEDNYESFPNFKNELLFKFFPNEKLQKQIGKEHGFQLFFTLRNNEINVYLIDLYHLGIPSVKDINKNKFDLNDEYDRRKKYKHDIKDCLFDIY